MTYKYCAVRHHIYEACSEKTIYRWRTFKEVRKLFKARLWIILGCTILCFLCALVLITMQEISRWWSTIPCIVAFSLSTYYKINFDSFYNKNVREAEMEDRHIAYTNYVQTAVSTLVECGIDTKEKRDYLKSECEQMLSKHEQKYLTLNNRTYEMLIGVPLGALISSIIYNQNANSLEGIIVLILLGLFIIIGSQIGRKISFYSDGYFKDRHLLNVLRELEYVDS